MQRDLRGLGGRRLHAELPPRRGQHEAGRQTARYAVGRQVSSIDNPCEVIISILQQC